MSSEEQSVSVSEAPMSSEGGDDGEWQPPPEWPAAPTSTMHLVVQGYTPMPIPTRREDPEEPLPAVDPTLPPLPKEEEDPVAVRRAKVGQMAMESDKVASGIDVWEKEREEREAYAAATKAWMAKGGTCAQGAARRGPYNKKMPSPVGKMHPIEMARLAKEVSQPPVPLAKSRIGQLDPFPPHDNSLRHIKSLILEEFKRLAAKRAEEDKALALAASEATIAKLCEQGAGRTVTWSVHVSPLVVVVLAATAAYAAYLYWAAG